MSIFSTKKATTFFVGALCLGAIIWIALLEPQKESRSKVSGDFGISEMNQTESSKAKGELQEVGRSPYIPPEAQPAVDFLLALSQDDYEVMPNLFTLKALNKIQKYGWEQFSAIWVYSIERSGQSLNPGQYSISYRGDSNEGKVRFLSPGLPDLKINVALEEGNWLVNEQ